MLGSAHPTPPDATTKAATVVRSLPCMDPCYRTYRRNQELIRPTFRRYRSFVASGRRGCSSTMLATAATARENLPKAVVHRR